MTVKASATEERADLWTMDGPDRRTAIGGSGRTQTAEAASTWPRHVAPNAGTPRG